jgi:hypothetical protein
MLPSIGGVFHYFVANLPSLKGMCLLFKCIHFILYQTCSLGLPEFSNLGIEGLKAGEALWSRPSPRYTFGPE